ncbi:tachylectin-related carbohydrate-binding protein [Nocardia asteroides]|uniref:tachylectin-related carbohydrate-binding protein n=1 Tax=Nocardia asteroides TaxID=1824 RepID=UPI0037CAB897
MADQDPLKGDDVYRTMADAAEYLPYVSTAFTILQAIYTFGRESSQEKAIRELNERVGRLEELVTALDDRLSDVEYRVGEAENRRRLDSITQHQLAFIAMTRDLRSHPEDASDIAANAFDRLSAMISDDDLWLWTDAVHKRTEPADSWRPAPPFFKGVGLPAFSIGAMLWALAAAQAIGNGAPRSDYSDEADTIVGWTATRTDWDPTKMEPKSLTERFRRAIRAEVWIGTKFRTPAGECEYTMIAVSDIDHARARLRDVTLFFGRDDTAMCTADPAIAAGDEALLQDQAPQIMSLGLIEDAASRIRHRGTLADESFGEFPGWTAHQLTLFGIERNGDLRRYQLDTTTALVAPPKVVSVGSIAGTGWDTFTTVYATQDNILYGFHPDRAIDWFRQDLPDLSPSTWTGPRRITGVNPDPDGPFEQREAMFNGGQGTFYRTSFNVFGGGRSLLLASHADVDNGMDTVIPFNSISTSWPHYATLFSAGEGVIYGIDKAGDLYWHRHVSWPTLGTQVEGPIRIASGWNAFIRVFAFGNGFIMGLHASGQLMLHHFRQWRFGPGNDEPIWRGPVRVPGTQWRGFTALVPSIGDRPIDGLH